MSKSINIIIAAAGMGSRLRPFTSNIPKALVEINGVPILEHQLRIIESKKIDHLVIVLGYKGHLIRNFIESRMPKYKVTYVENNDFDKTGCGWSLMKAFQIIHDGFIYMNCDLLFSKLNYEKLLEANKNNLILVRSLTNTNETILQKVEAIDGRVARMDLTLSGKYQYEAVGPVKINMNSCESLDKLYSSLDSRNQKNIRCYTLFGLLAEIESISIEVISDKSWAEVNTPEDRLKAVQIIKTL